MNKNAKERKNIKKKRRKLTEWHGQAPFGLRQQKTWLKTAVKMVLVVKRGQNVCGCGYYYYYDGGKCCDGSDGSYVDRVYYWLLWS